MDDILWGAAAIGKVISRTEQQVFHLVATGALPPVRKVGGKLAVSRRALLEHFGAQPLLFTPTRLTLDHVRYPDPFAAVTAALTYDIGCFLAACGFDVDRRDAKLAELTPDLCEIVLRKNRPTIVLRYDGNDVKWYTTVDNQIERTGVGIYRTAEGHIGMDRNPAQIREWIAAKFFDTPAQVVA